MLISLRELRAMLACAEEYMAQSDEPDEDYEFLFARLPAGAIKDNDGTNYPAGIYMADGSCPEEGVILCDVLPSRSHHDFNA